MKFRAPARPLVLCLLAAALPLAAQSYQTSFSEVKFDRAKTPATFHGGASVDLPTGALTYDVPMGPGIGARGLKFIPTLTTRFAPQITPPNPWNYYLSTAQSQVSWGGINCAFTPGFFVLGVAADHGQGPTIADEFLLPMGGTGSLVSAGGDLPNSLLQGSDGVNLALAFGLTGVTSTILVRGSNGELILYLAGPAYPTQNLYRWRDTIDYPNPPYPGASVETFPAPGGILVISPDGATATEFTYVNPQYRLPFYESPTPAAVPSRLERVRETDGDHLLPKDLDANLPNDLVAVHYLPVSMRNRLGDVISFDHHKTLQGGAGNGVDYVATWSYNGATLGSVAVTLQTGPPIDHSVPVINAGVTNTSSARIQVDYSGSNLPSYTVDAYERYGISVQSYEAWGQAKKSAWDQFRRDFQAIQVTMSPTGEAVQFGYQDTVGDIGATLHSLTMPGRQVTFTWASYPYRKANAVGGWGFVLLGAANTDVYRSAGVVQVEDRDLTSGGQTRTTTYDRVVPVPDADHESGPYWSSTEFHVAVTHPDGRVSFTRYAEPINGLFPEAATPSQTFQSLAFLKHVATEIRDYAPGQNWSSDLSAPASASSAYHVVQYGAPATGAESDRFAVDGWLNNTYWGLAKVWNSQGMGSASVPYPLRTESWDRDAGGAISRHQVEVRTDWDPVGFGWQTRRYQSDAGANAVVQTSSYDYESIPAAWWMSRVTSERRPGQPPIRRTYDDLNRVTLVEENPGGDPEVDVHFAYSGHMEPDSAWLTSPTLSQSGLVGATYGFDGTTGFVNSISPWGVSFNYQQTEDAYRRVLSQTDPNGFAVSIGYEAAGRLGSIDPQGGEVGTSYVYDPDNLGVGVTRGAQASHFRYNGFGELVKVTRNNVDQVFSYDLGGRKTFESVWGDPSRGVTTTYDAQGRTSSLTDANGQVTRTTYSGPSRTVAVDPDGLNLVTTFTSDALGRLVSVLDAKGQTTTYLYDDGDRIVAVFQAGEPGTQGRTWTYNALGWITNLFQPESGATTYSSFTVSGKPQVASYAGRSVITGYDSLGRALNVNASDGSVAQSYTFDQGANGKGKLASSSDGSITSRFTYTGLNGRLSGLETTVPLSVGGANQTFSQTFGYNTYGFRSSSALPGGRSLSYTYDEARGVGSGVGSGGGSLASVTAFNAVDLPLGISFSNNVSTSFAYDADLTRLHSLAHSRLSNGAPVASGSAWTYAYDGAGRMTGDGTDVFAYDALSRLTSATVKLPSSWNTSSPLVQTFGYDAFGNQVSSVASMQAGPMPVGLANLINTFQFSPSNAAWLKNQLPAFALLSGQETLATGAQYDAQGNLTRIYKQAGQSSKEVTLAYDALGRVTQMTDAERNMTEKYFYTAEGLRTRIETWAGGVLQKVQIKLYNDQRQLVSEYEAVAQ